MPHLGHRASTDIDLFGPAALAENGAQLLVRICAERHGISGQPGAFEAVSHEIERDVRLSLPE